MRKILFIFGTRPEAIKLAPLIKEFQKNKKLFKTFVCVTAQHREMLDQVLDFFKIRPDYDLDIMRPDQTLFQLTAQALLKLENILNKTRPDLIFVQGDTTTAFIGALAGYYRKIKVAHVEAGLRSFNKYSPYPEELNRILTGQLTDLHFAPTALAGKNLRKEGITKNIFVVKNTVIDALFLSLDIIKNNREKYKKTFNFIDLKKKIILVTGHRRESFGEPFKNICLALKDLAENNTDLEIVYPVHLNPNVRKPVFEVLKRQKRVHLIEPLNYPSLVWLLQQAHLVITDSGGIQEEAPSLGKPVIVMREVTERVEGIKSGTAILAGTSRQKIVNLTEKLLKDQVLYRKMAKAVNPYGDGKTSKRIVNVVKKSI